MKYRIYFTIDCLTPPKTNLNIKDLINEVQDLCTGSKWFSERKRNRNRDKSDSLVDKQKWQICKKDSFSLNHEKPCVYTNKF